MKPITYHAACRVNGQPYNTPCKGFRLAPAFAVGRGLRGLLAGTPEQDNTKAWEIIHIPTGLLIKGGFRTRREAAKVVNRLCQVPDVDWPNVTHAFEMTSAIVQAFRELGVPA